MLPLAELRVQRGADQSSKWKQYQYNMSPKNETDTERKNQYSVGTSFQPLRITSGLVHASRPLVAEAIILPACNGIPSRVISFREARMYAYRFQLAVGATVVTRNKQKNKT